MASSNASGGGATGGVSSGGVGVGAGVGGAQGTTAPGKAGATAASKMHIEHSATTTDKGLKMKIKRTKPGTKTSEAKHEIVKSSALTQNAQGGANATVEQNGTADQADMKAPSPNQPQQNQTAQSVSHSKHSSGGNTAGGGGSSGSTGSGGMSNAASIMAAAAAAAAAQAANQNNTSSSNKRSSSGHRNRDKTREKHSSSGTTVLSTSDSTKPPKSPPEMNGRPPSGGQSVPRAVFPPASTGPGPPPAPSPKPPNSPAGQPQIGTGAVATGHDDGSGASPPPIKKLKTENKEVTDVCVGTSVGTITEPDCLGPCEPGTSVTLEGIVWHETEGGVLVVNVTWRGKTYVGTLLDCTRHDWAPPRFCDSPTSDLDNRTPKGRETRSSAHSKLRNGGAAGNSTTTGSVGGAKGRRNGNANSGSGAASGGGGTAPASPTGTFVPPRPDNKRKQRSGEEESNTGNNGNGSAQTQQNATPHGATPSGATVSQAAKKAKSSTPTVVVTTTPSHSPPPSPVLLECPEPNCSKKYKHINGLKYHQSHAHGSITAVSAGTAVPDDIDMDTKDISENDESNIEAPSPATPVKSPEKPVATDSPTSIPVATKKDPAPTEAVSQPSTPPSPAATPQEVVPGMPASPAGTQQDKGQQVAVPGATAAATQQQVVKPGVLRYTPTQGQPQQQDEYGIGVFSPPQGKPQVTGNFCNRV
ncbi:unnamed protein product [Acanthoscelides obtectus]|uniref:C2H2-type domain-containing protein n=1 Tax=Acanthoscelides obtectus TaxID=200917 RepID=A0A9P0P8V9_ACAOB|nr:unnamed protein product [Acanthoscelides obtectus]CAK1656952.1 Zinc finger protein 609 [Acanthoscelides obtectus]